MKKRTLPMLLLLAGLSATAFAACGHEHSYSWKTTEDGTKHYQECTCGDKKDPVDHVDANSDEICDECGANLHVHAYTWKPTEDGKKHYQECACGDKKEPVDHSPANSEEKCPDCGADLHVHAYDAWSSDANGHWKQCSCGEKSSEGTHKDENSDNKCDDCARDYFAVTFNMHDHGTAPAEQKVISGGKAIAPATPVDDDAFKFKGWFKDESCTQAFDFAQDIVNAATTLHAKWEEDTTEGASKAHAFALTKDVECLKPAKKGVVTYFKYVAEEAGRFTVSLGAGVNSQNATFTTSLTGDTVFGKEQTAEEAHFDLAEGDTVYVMYTFLGEEGEDVTAGVVIADTTDEPLPDDHFLDGEYENDSYSYSIVLNREEKTITYYNTDYQFTYVGGSVDTLSFVISGWAGETTYTLHHEGEGVYAFSSGTYEMAKLKLFVAPAVSVPLSDIFGHYVPVDEAHQSISEIYVYEGEAEDTTTVRFNQNSSYNTQSGYSVTYTAKKNRLQFGLYTAIVKLTENGAVESLIIGDKEYVKDGEAGKIPPEKIDIEESSEYFGETYQIRDSYGYSQYFGTGYDAVIVMGYAEDTGMYTVTTPVDGTYTTFKLTVSEDKKTIILYNAEGTQLDTLTKFVWNYHDVPATSKEISVQASEFQKGKVYLFKATTEGWYAFTGVAEGVEIYYNLNKTDPLSKSEGQKVGEDAVKLAADAIVGVYMDEPAATTFTVAPSEAPVGWTAEKPKLVEGSATVGGITPETTYYFKLVAPAAGNYMVHVFYGEPNDYNKGVQIKFTVNDEEYDFSSNYKIDDACAPIEATAEGDVCITVITSDNLGSYHAVTVSVTEDYSANATDVELAGTPAEGKLTLSATVATGSNYHLVTTHGSSVTVTGNAAFTMKFQNGSVAKAEEVEGTFTATISQGEDIYFTVASETQQNVTLSQTFAHGSAGYPIEASAEEGENTIEVGFNTVYFTLPAGIYVMNSTESESYITVGSDEFAPGIITVEEGDVLSFSLSSMSSANSATLTISVAVKIFTEEQVGTYVGKAANSYGYEQDVEFTFSEYGAYSYRCGYTTARGAITKGEDGVYSFFYTQYNWSTDENDIYTVTFQFVDGKISITDPFANSGAAFTLGKKVVEAIVTYTGTIGSDSESADAKLEIAGTTISYYRDMGSGELELMLNATFEEDNGTLTYTDMWGTYTVTYSEDGNTVYFVDGGIGWSGTLTKEA